MLDPKQRHTLLMADRTGDPDWIAAAIKHLLAVDPDVDLLDVEAALRTAAAQAYLIADDAGFRMVIGVQSWIAELRQSTVTECASNTILAAGHAVNIDQPQAFIDAVQPFLDGLDSRATQKAAS